MSAMEVDGRVWAVVTATAVQGREFQFQTYFSIWEMAENFYNKMTLLPHYAASYPIETTQ